MTLIIQALVLLVLSALLRGEPPHGPRLPAPVHRHGAPGVTSVGGFTVSDEFWVLGLWCMLPGVGDTWVQGLGALSFWFARLQMPKPDISGLLGALFGFGASRLFCLRWRKTKTRS